MEKRDARIGFSVKSNGEFLCAKIFFVFTLTLIYADHQGSVIALSDSAGKVSNALAYDAYGIPGGGNVERFGYTGQIWFKDLGLFHYKARMYSPTLGRFLQTDPIGYKDQMNLYAYVGNDPLNKYDPKGMQTFGIPANQSQANRLYFSSVSASFYQKPEPLATREQIHTLAGHGSNAAFVAGAGCTLACTPLVGAGFFTASGILGVVEAVTSDTPGAAVAAEVFSLGTSKKIELIGDVAKVAGATDTQMVDVVTETIQHTTGEAMTDLFENKANATQLPLPPPVDEAKQMKK